jgi:hypothetical protein
MVGKKSHTKKKLRKEMTAAIGDEEEYVKRKKKSLVFLFMASVPSRALIKQRDEMDLFGFWGRTYCLVFDLRLLFFLISCIRMNPFVYVFFLECVVGIVDQIHKGEPTVIVRTLLYLHL